jgi:Cytochrome c biogenesis protein
MKEIYPNIEVREYSVAETKNKELLTNLGKIYNISENKLNVTPAVFIGKSVFVREEAYKNVEIAIKNFNYEDNAFLEDSLLKAQSESSNLVLLFKKFGVLTVIGAGLIDGYNPCAITVLIFFISLLALRKKDRREILLVGTLFTIGIGLSYLLLGVGLFELISRWKYFDYISKYVYLLTSLITLTLVVLTFSDYFKAKRGDTKGITLQLSTAEKKTIHALLRNPRVLTEFIFAFLVAFPVSIVEFSCTGQTYLPTIVYIFGMENLRAQAFLYLLLYNVMFVLPLIIITYIAYRGTNSLRISKWFTQNLSTIKLATGIVFLILFGYLGLKTLSLFNLITLRI